MDLKRKKLISRTYLRIYWFMSVVKENVTVSILVKSSFAVLAVFGFVTLWMAVAFGDMGLSLAVILNALRIGNGKTVKT